MGYDAGVGKGPQLNSPWLNRKNRFNWVNLACLLRRI